MKQLITTMGVCLIASVPAVAAPQNLIKNGDFEQLKSGNPVAWKVGQLPDVTESTYPTEKGQGNIAQIRFLKWDGHAASFSQSVKVKPNTNYQLALKARMNMGNMRIAVSGGKGDAKVDIVKFGRAAHYSMFPQFWKESWAKYLIFEPNKWRDVIINFNSGNADSVLIAFGGYQRAGTYSFDDVLLTEKP